MLAFLSQEKLPMFSAPHLQKRLTWQVYLKRKFDEWDFGALIP